MLSVQKPKNVTLVEILSDGYRAVNRQPWLVLIPVVFNLYLWFGTQLSFAPLISDWQSTVQALQQAQSSPFGSGLSAEMQQQSAQQFALASQLDMRQPLAIFNYIPTTIYVLGSLGLAGGGLGVPLVQALPLTLDSQRNALQVQHLGGALLAFLLLNVLVLLLSAAFLTMVAEAVRGERLAPALWLQRLARATRSLFGYAALLIGAAILLGLPVLVIAGLLLALSPVLGAFAALLLVIAWFWANVYLGFALEAIVISGIGPLRALHASFNIVRRNFWSTLLFLILLLVIAVGTGIIWQAVAAAASTAGLIIAIIGSAYICCGLVAARMAFYRERLHRWQVAVDGVRGAPRISPPQ